MIRRATVNDAYTIARFRQAMYDEMAPDQPSTPVYRDALYVYWYQTLESGAGVGWIAEVDEQPVGMTMLLIHQHPPRPTGDVRRGFVSSVYVAPLFRRQGHGEALMDAVIAYGREQGLQRLELRASEMGRPLYERMGFEHAEFWLYRFDQATAQQHEAPR